MTFGASTANASWAEEEGFQYEVWTDDDKTLAVALGAASSTRAFFPDRETYLLDAEGNLILSYTEDIVVGTHPNQVYEDLVILFGP